MNIIGGNHVYEPSYLIYPEKGTYLTSSDVAVWLPLKHFWRMPEGVDFSLPEEICKRLAKQ